MQANHLKLVVLSTVLVACSESVPDARRSTAGLAPSAPTAAVEFDRVKSLLDQHCVSCHSGSAPAHDVDLSTYERLIEGRPGHGPLLAVGNPAESVIIHALRGHGGAKGDSAKHRSVAGAFPDSVVSTLERWIANGAQPSGSDSLRSVTTLRLQLITVADGQGGFYRWRGHFTSVLDSLRVIAAPGVRIDITRADSSMWEARLTHARLAVVCTIGGRAGVPTTQLTLSTTGSYCIGG